MATTHVVNISDCKAASDPADTIVTYALGSCIGLALYDPDVTVGGILHLMLPHSRYRASTREFNPFMYADSGFYAFVELAVSLGAEKNRLVAKVVGGANMLRHSSVLDIGKRNTEAVLSLLDRERIPVLGTSVGGTLGRSMRFRLNDGLVRVRLLGRGEEEL
jgi:chemotaxis protein CheD